MALLTRIGQGGVGATYGTIADKAESIITMPSPQLTRIAVGGAGQTYGIITDKSEDIGGTPRPGNILTRIGVGGVGAYYTITDKQVTINTVKGGSMLSSLLVRRSMRRGRGR